MRLIISKQRICVPCPPYNCMPLRDWNSSPCHTLPGKDFALHYACFIFSRPSCRPGIHLQQQTLPDVGSLTCTPSSLVYSCSAPPLGFYLPVPKESSSFLHYYIGHRLYSRKSHEAGLGLLPLICLCQSLVCQNSKLDCSAGLCMRQNKDLVCMCEGSRSAPLFPLGCKTCAVLCHASNTIVKPWAPADVFHPRITSCGNMR